LSLTNAILKKNFDSNVINLIDTILIQYAILFILVDYIITATA